MIQALYKAAKSQLKEIEKKDGAQTYLGNWISLDDVEVSADWKDPKKSLLAQVNQSYEAMLLYPALELAIRHQKDEDGFYLSLYQYDGISIMAKQPEKTEYWATKVKEVVDENAKWCGIKTTLEFVLPTKPKNL
jgi:IMP cyclohydrolase